MTGSIALAPVAAIAGNGEGPVGSGGGPMPAGRGWLLD